MASISTASSGRRTIQFVQADGRRSSIRLGLVSQRQAEAVKHRVEDLLASKLTGQAVSRQTAAWLGDIDDGLHRKLAGVGLVEARESSTLGKLIETYARENASRVKPTTLLTWDRAKGHLLGYFGESRDLASITPGDADAFRAWMTTERKPKLSDNTARKTVQITRQFMKAAKRKGYIEADPFSHLPSTVRPNRGRDHFVTREQAEAVISACPDHEFRLLVALARYAGLRIPSEARALRWQDIDWQRERFTVNAEKTEHHAHGGVRVVPIFPELRPHLLEAYERAEEGAEYVVPRLRPEPGGAAKNVCTQIGRIIKRAGVKAWKKPWQNMRASCETDLAGRYPLHVVTAWCGHTPKVAMGFYLQVRDDDYTEAVQKAVHETVQNRPAVGSNEKHKAASACSEVDADTAFSDLVPFAASTCVDQKGLTSGP